MSNMNELSEDKFRVEEGVESLWENVRKKAQIGLVFIILFSILYVGYLVFIIFYFLGKFSNSQILSNSIVAFLILGFFILLSFFGVVFVLPMSLAYFTRRVTFKQVKTALDQQDLEALTKIIRHKLTAYQRRHRNYIYDAILDKTINKYQCALYALAEIEDVDSAEYLYYFMHYDDREKVRAWAEDGLEYYARLHGYQSIDELNTGMQDKKIEVDIEDSTASKIQSKKDYKTYSFLKIAIKNDRVKSIVFSIILSLFFTPFLITGIVLISFTEIILGIITTLIGILGISFVIYVEVKGAKRIKQIKNLFQENNSKELLRLAKKPDKIAISALVDLGSASVAPIIIDSLRDSWEDLRESEKITYFNMFDALSYKLQFDTREELLESVYPSLSTENQDFVKYILS